MSDDFDRGFNTDWSDPWQTEMADRQHAYGQPAAVFVTLTLFAHRDLERDAPPPVAFLPAHRVG